jgi:hypothetical protein
LSKSSFIESNAGAARNALFLDVALDLWLLRVLLWLLVFLVILRTVVAFAHCRLLFAKFVSRLIDEPKQHPVDHSLEAKLKRSEVSEGYQNAAPAKSKIDELRGCPTSLCDFLRPESFLPV